MMALPRAPSAGRKRMIEQHTCLYQSTVWFGLGCVLLAALFMGLSAIKIDFRWAGILFICLGAIDLIVFLILRYNLKKSGGSTNTCGFLNLCCKDCCKSCCNGLLLTCCCLKEPQASRRASLREIAVARVERRESGRSSRNNRNVNSISEELTQRQTEIRANLRSLERHINILFRDYTVVENRMNRLRNSESSDRRYLINRERVQEKLLMVQDSMHREYRKLCRWYQGNDSCTVEDVERAKERLRNVREHMKSIQRRIERIERTNESADNHRSIRRSNSRSRGEQIQTLTENRHSAPAMDTLTVPNTHYSSHRRSSSPEAFTARPGFERECSSPDVLSPLPPPYQEEDPLPEITLQYVNQEQRAGVHRGGSFRSRTISQASSGPEMVRMDSFISAASLVASSSNGAEPSLPVILPSATTGSGALVLRIPRDAVTTGISLGIQTLEAPPSYEEASSSQV